MQPPSGKPPRRGKLVLARWVSIIGHPFVLSLALVAGAAASSLAPRRAALVVGLVFLASIVPMLVYLTRQVRTGRSNFDVSVRTQRGPLFGIALVLGLGLLAALLALGVPRRLLAVAVGALAVVALASLVNRRLKVSLHTSFAVFSGIALAAFDLRAGGALLAAAPLVAWSRVTLGRHTLPEVVAGVALGLAVGGLLAAFLSWL